MLSTYELTHGLSVLKTPHTYINNIKSWINVWDWNKISPVSSCMHDW